MFLNFSLIFKGHFFFHDRLILLSLQIFFIYFWKEFFFDFKWHFDYFDSYDAWMHSIIFIAVNIKRFSLHVLYVIYSFFSTFSVLIMFLKKVINVSANFVPCVTSSFFSKYTLSKIIDIHLSEATCCQLQNL